MKKNLDVTKPRYMEQMFPSPLAHIEATLQ